MQELFENKIFLFRKVEVHDLLDNSENQPLQYDYVTDMNQIDNNMSIGTKTLTEVKNETTDSDNEFSSLNSLSYLLGTETITKDKNESSDSDDSICMSNHFIQNGTLTKTSENMEETDSDETNSSNIINQLYSKNLLGTETLTLVNNESTDSDQDNLDLLN